MEKTVYFRTFEEEDSELIYQWMNDDDLKKLSVGLNRRMSREEALSWVKRRMEHDQYNYWWAICAKDTNTMIGYLSLNNIHYINRSAEFGGLVIGDKEHHDGFAWIESYLFVYEYAFERLGLNRVYGTCLIDHKQTRAMGLVMFSKREGVLRQAVYKNGQYRDLSIGSLLSCEYFEHKNHGDYEVSAIIRRIKKARKEMTNAE